MKVFGVTDCGLVRKQNQDYYDAHCESDGLIAVVCDGMGGAKSGNVASQLAVESFLAQFAQEDLEQPVLALNNALHFANAEVYQRSHDDEDCSGMGTTMVCAYVPANLRACVLNVGDSRAYLITQQGITQVTRDHSLVADLVARGKITPEAARTHPNKNIITRALGTDRMTVGDVFEVDLVAGDYLLLCSDGLSNVVSDQEMLYEVLYGGMDSTCCRRLLDIALQRGAPDNVTAVLICTGEEESE